MIIGLNLELVVSLPRFKGGCTANSNMPSLSSIKKVVVGINFEILPYPGY